MEAALQNLKRFIFFQRLRVFDLFLYQNDLHLFQRQTIRPARSEKFSDGIAVADLPHRRRTDDGVHQNGQRRIMAMDNGKFADDLRFPADFGSNGFTVHLPLRPSFRQLVFVLFLNGCLFCQRRLFRFRIPAFFPFGDRSLFSQPDHRFMRRRRIDLFSAFPVFPHFEKAAKRRRFVPLLSGKFSRLVRFVFACRRNGNRLFILPSRRIHIPAQSAPQSLARSVSDDVVRNRFSGIGLFLYCLQTPSFYQRMGRL